MSFKTRCRWSVISWERGRQSIFFCVEILGEGALGCTLERMCPAGLKWTHQYTEWETDGKPRMPIWYRHIAYCCSRKCVRRVCWLCEYIALSLYTFALWPFNCYLYMYILSSLINTTFSDFLRKCVLLFSHCYDIISSHLFYINNMSYPLSLPFYQFQHMFLSNWQNFHSVNINIQQK